MRHAGSRAAAGSELAATPDRAHGGGARADRRERAAGCRRPPAPSAGDRAGLAARARRDRAAPVAPPRSPRHTEPGRCPRRSGADARAPGARDLPAASASSRARCVSGPSNGRDRPMSIDDHGQPGSSRLVERVAPPFASPAHQSVAAALPAALAGDPPHPLLAARGADLLLHAGHGLRRMAGALRLPRAARPDAFAARASFSLGPLVLDVERPLRVVREPLSSHVARRMSLCHAFTRGLPPDVARDRPVDGAHRLLREPGLEVQPGEPVAAGRAVPRRRARR